MRPDPYHFETADGKKFTVDCLTLGQIRALEAMFSDRERLQSMSGLDVGMESLKIMLSVDYPDIDVTTMRIIGGAETLAEITRAVMMHGGMRSSSGEAEPARSQ